MKRRQRTMMIAAISIIAVMVTGCGAQGNANSNVTTPQNTDRVGEIIQFGSYEQDNDLSNGAEPIEWEVVGTRDGHTLLLSKYALDCKKYNDNSGSITWENCTLREWLNNDFYNTAFSDTEKKRIATVFNENPDSYELYKPWLFELGSTYGAEGGNTTRDNVFLLSWTEARDFLNGKLYDQKIGGKNYNQKLICKPTAYARARGAWAANYTGGSEYPNDVDGCCCWWLRSPGSFRNEATHVFADGDIEEAIVNRGDFAVRPAILID